ncbi:PRC-barrel domain-containing protein [Streptomyces sp. Tue6028]|uniref:PRC-barrel domain-containing protein n=1 Tax=Streptomyces sp. Tue6028 TaxID=2036037 RepID=UPI00211C415F|nr:PRC-barrel domain-containing protein [Streptomyces sp. Tue6028]
MPATQKEYTVTVDRIWSYAPEFGHPEAHELTGYSVEATDGTIGHVDRQADDSGMRHLIVDTGVWVFGKSVLVPVGVVAGIDTESQKITVSCTREEIKSAPVFKTDRETFDPAYLADVGSYYRSLPAGRPD